MTIRRLIVVGVGGIGTWLAEGLVRALEFNDPGSMLILCDGDTFEPKNAERQTFKSLGNKAEVVAGELTKFFPKTFIVPRAQWVVDKFEDPEVVESEKALLASVLLQENDVCFVVVDNFAARKLIFDAAREYENIDIITGGNDDALFTSTYHYQRRNSQDITDHPAEYHDSFINPPDRNPGTMSCQEKAMLEGGVQFLASNMTVAGMLLGKYQHCIIEGNDPRPAGEIMFDIGLGLAKPNDRAADEVLVEVS